VTYAESPQQVSGGKSAQHVQRVRPKSNAYFDANDRIVVRENFAHELRSGHFPPGSARKRNSGMPPGDVKESRIGRSRSSDVTIYDVPSELVV